MTLRSVPLAEVVVVITLFFGIVCVDAGLEISDRVLFQTYSIAEAVERLDSEHRLRERLALAGTPVLLPATDDPWAHEPSPLMDEKRSRPLGIGFAEIPSDPVGTDVLILAVP